MIQFLKVAVVHKVPGRVPLVPGLLSHQGGQCTEDTNEIASGVKHLYMSDGGSESCLGWAFHRKGFVRAGWPMVQVAI